MSMPEIAETLAENLPPAVEPTPAAFDRNALPTLYRDTGFWGMTVTQFLGAFNDNLFKQLVLLLSISAVGAAATAGGEDNQGPANFIFSLPFLLTTGYAGYLADRFSKRRIIVACKVAEIAVMAAGAVAFALYTHPKPGQVGNLAFLYVVLFFMGAHSGFFGPAKYGILPEMLRDEDLPRANGFILMTTFLAIILGTVVAGVLLDYFPRDLWVASIACMSIAVVGTLASLWVRPLPPSNPNMKFEWSALTVPPDMIALLKADRPLFLALIVSSIFWLLAGMVPSAVNALGKLEHLADYKHTSALLGVVSIGIALGGALGGIASGGKVDFRVLRVGAFGMLACMMLLAVPAHGDAAALLGPDQTLTRLPGVAESRQWLGYWGSMATLLVLGGFTGCFAVPLQVFMQKSPPAGKKGRMIAVMNQANWIGIAIAGVLYSGLAKLIELYDWPRCTMFFFIGLLMLPIALFYHPQNE